MTFLCYDFILAMCDLYHYDLLLSLLFSEHFLPHNRQCKLVQDISHDKLNIVMLKVNLVFDIKTTAQFSAFECYFNLSVIWKKFLTRFFLDFIILQPLSPWYGNSNRCIFLLSLSFSLVVLDGTCWTCWTCLKTLSITYEE